MLFVDRFFREVQQDLKIFIFFNLLFTIFRIIFLAFFNEQLTTVAPGDILLCLWYGLRLSLKLSGGIMAIGFLVCSLPYIVWSKWPEKLLHIIWGSFAILIFTFLFVARLPYYQIFNYGYNMMLLNGAKDDWHAIFQTAQEEYHLWANLGIVVVAALLFSFILYKILQAPVCQPTSHKGAKAVVVLVLTPVFFLFVRFGGGYSYDTGINWEQTALFKSHLLNEAILDDGQSLYRTYISWHRLNNIAVNLNEKDLRESIKVLGGKADAATIEDAFVKENKWWGSQADARQVVVIFGENHALWPFLDRYKDLHLVDKEKARFKENAAQLGLMLAGGDGTMRSLNVLLAGLPDNAMYENYAPESYTSKYATGIANVMNKLGFKCVFWYGGIGSWQDVAKFAKAQGFAEFYSGADSDVKQAGAWGVPDAELFTMVDRYMAQHTEEKLFHFILTTSNHPPYALDVDSMGYPRRQVADKLPKTIANTKANLNQLGHIWYADMTIDAFIGKTQEIDPSALFVVTGDHAERFTFAQQEEMDALYAVPCILYGRDVNPKWLKPTGVGSHGQIMPTLVELLSPEGYKYNSIYASLLETEDYAFNRLLWASKGNEIGTLDTLINKNLLPGAQEKLREQAKAAEIVTAWRVIKGNKI